MGFGAHCFGPMYEGIDHTVFASQIRLWWLSHWRYKSVWVGFQYILVVKVLSCCGVKSVSRNGMEQSGLVSSVVNIMEGSTELMYCKNSSLHDCWSMSKVSSFCKLGGSLLMLWPCVQMIPYTNKVQWGSQKTPWMPPWFVYKIDLGTKSRCYINRIPAALGCGRLTWLFFWEVLCLFPACYQCDQVCLPGVMNSLSVENL